MKREMKWLKERSQKQVPVTFGAPWGRGELPKGSSLALIGGDGKELPCQVKPTAYWPDGSIKCPFCCTGSLPELYNFPFRQNACIPGTACFRFPR